ncbi:MAG: UDP-N-acetylmuramoyl-L-alanyl-D-glutamate--2,6-diaminopimelate ligase [Pseudomonadota bacterium]
MNKITLENGLKIEVKGLSIDSRYINSGELFCACVGSKTQINTNDIKSSHGIAYAGQAIKRGAVAILWEPTADITEMPKFCQETALYKVEGLHKKLGQFAAEFYQYPSLEMQIIGVTGTNGKTSVTQFLAQILTEQDTLCGLIGTLGNGLYGKIESSNHTTPDAIKVQKLLREMKTSEAAAVTIEVSSHALHQYRVDHVNFDIAVFTNLTRDHLDYHGSMENYANEKKKLFLCDSLKTAVINQDDNFAEQIEQIIDRKQTKVIAFSTSMERAGEYVDEMMYSKNIHYHACGSRFELCLGEHVEQVELPLIGHFNISNALATAAVLHALGYGLAVIAKALGQLKSVAGRMELINNQLNKKIQLIVDYAHTPDALEQAIKALKSHSNNKLWCVFGCGGNRDKGKRAEMAEVSALNADHIIITSDNPRDEEPMAIIQDIEKGMNGHTNYRIEPDRIKAIKLAIDLAEQGDMILVAGKGHENYQEIKGIKYDYSDRETCRELLAA